MIELPTGDTVIATRRKHWLMLVLPLLPLVIAAVLPFVLYGWLAGNTFEFGAISMTIPSSLTFLSFASSLWLLIIWMRVGHLFTDYYLDVWTLTDKHLVGMDQRTLFHRHTAIVRIERIQDVTVEVEGIIETFFEYGDLRVQSAGESPEFVMRGVSDPHKFRELILSEQDKLLKRVPDSITGVDPQLSRTPQA